MSQEIQIPVRGIYSSPNPLTLPEGALVTAQNCVMRRPGVIEPRRGFTPTTTLPFTSGDTVSHLFSYDGRLYAVCQTGSPARVGLASSADGGATWTTVTPGQLLFQYGFAPYRQRTAVARLNCYLARGVYGGTLDFPALTQKLTSGAATTAVATGLATPPIPRFSVTAAGVAVVTNTTVAYRIVFRSSDANNLVVRSSPSSRYYYSNATGGTVDVQLTWRCHSQGGYGLVAGDVVELYRSGAVTGVSGVVPDDEMALVSEHVVTAAEAISAGGTITDRCTPTGRGAALYTNASQEGILQANKRPPTCEDLALFNDCLFFAQAVEDPRGTLFFTNVSQVTGFNFHNNAGANFAGNTLNGNPTITGIASTADFDVGQLVVQNVVPGTAGVNIPADARIISKTAASITLDKNATGAAAITFQACDVVQVDGQDFFAYSSTANVVGFPRFGANLFGAGAITARQMAENLAWVVTENTGRLTGIVVTDVNTQAGLVFEKVIEASGSTIVVRSHADAASPATQPFDPVAKPNRLMWSKPSEPEHVPDANFAVIGSEKNVIRRITALRDGLLIWSDDGLFRLTGTFPDFRIDGIDRTVMLAGFNTVATVDDYCYALTESGVVKASIAGVEARVSDPIWETIKRTVYALLDTSTAQLPKLDSWAFYNHNEDEYYLKLPNIPLTTGAAALNNNTLYVYSARHDAWTTWSMAAEAGVTHTDGKIYIANPSLATSAFATNVVTQERHGTSELIGGDLYKLDYCDATITTTPTVSSVGTSSIVISAPVSATLGAFVLIGGNLVFKVTSGVSSSATIPLNSVTGITPGASVAIYESFSAAIEWQPLYAGNSAGLKQWQRIYVLFDEKNTLYRWSGNVYSDLQDSGAQTEAFTADITTTTGAAVGPQVQRMDVGRACAVGRALRFRWSSSEAYMRWAITGLAVEFHPVGANARRGNAIVST